MNPYLLTDLKLRNSGIRLGGVEAESWDVVYRDGVLVGTIEFDPNRGWVLKERHEHEVTKAMSGGVWESTVNYNLIAVVQPTVKSDQVSKPDLIALWNAVRAVCRPSSATD